LALAETRNALVVDTSSRAAQLCIEGTRAEFLRRIGDARQLYLEAWDAAEDCYEATIAAHYVAHLEPDPVKALRWHLVALERALCDARTEEFMGSLLVSLGGAFQAVGNVAQAERYYQLAAERGVDHVRA
jgi:hypothetical protein